MEDVTNEANTESATGYDTEPAMEDVSGSANTVPGEEDVPSGADTVPAAGGMTRIGTKPGTGVFANHANIEPGGGGGTGDADTKH